MSTARADLPTEVFLLPHGDHRVLFFPLLGKSYLVNIPFAEAVRSLIDSARKKDDSEKERSPQDREIYEFFHRERLFARLETRPRGGNPTFAPTAVSLFLTTECPLRCVYCYSSAGERAPRRLPFQMAAEAVDHVVSNAVNLRRDNVTVVFHGGGEPTAAWPLLQKIVSHARNKAEEAGVRLHLSMATNGLFDRSKLDWIMDRFDSLTLSMDGIPAVQDTHRPRADGKGSFRQIWSTAQALSECGFEFAIRATASDRSVRYMEEATGLFASELRPGRIHWEPLFSCGRALSSQVGRPEDRAFIEGFKRSYEIGRAAGIDVFYSGARFGAITDKFCLAAGESFCLTPDGSITACYEVNSGDDPRSESFFYGGYIDGKFAVDEERLGRLAERTAPNIEACRDCFCKFTCAGDCLARNYSGPDLGQIKQSRCTINQELTKFQILRSFEIVDAAVR